MFEPIDLRRVPALLLLLGAGMFLPTLLVRPGPPGSERQEAERRARRRRSWALRGMSAMTITGLCSGLAGGLLQSAGADSALAQLLHAVFRLCWLPAYALRELQQTLAATGPAGFGSALLEQLGLLLIPLVWFFIFFAAAGRCSGGNQSAGNEGG